MRRIVPLALGAALAALAGCDLTLPWSDGQAHLGQARGGAAIRTAEPLAAAPGVPFLLEVRGVGLVATGGTAGVVTLQRVRDLQGNAVDGPASTHAVAAGRAGAEEELSATIALDAAAPPGIYGLRIVGSGGGVAALDDFLAVLPRPSIFGLADAGVCAGAAAPSAVAVANLAVIDGRFGAAYHASSLGALVAEPAGCREVPFARAAIRLCDRIEVGVGALLRTPPGGPALDAMTIALAGPGAEPLTAVPFVLDGDVEGRLAGPPVGATGAPGLVPLDGGQSILVRTAPDMLATVDGASAGLRRSGCAPAAIAGWERCRLTAATPAILAPGTHSATLANLPGCRRTLAFEVRERPTVTGVSPTPLCAGAPALEISGTGMFDPVEVLVDGVAVASALCASPCDVVQVGLPVHLTPGARALSVEVATEPRLRSPEVALTVLSGPPEATRSMPFMVAAGHAFEVVIRTRTPPAGITGAAIEDRFSGAVVPASFTVEPGGVRVAFPVLPSSAYAVLLTESRQCTAVGGAVQLVSGAAVLRTTFDYFQDPFGVTWPGRGLDQCYSGGPELRASGGVPGGALAYAAPASQPGPWYFAFCPILEGYDLGRISFDLLLEQEGAGPTIDASDVVLSTVGASLERALAARPGLAWTHHDLDLNDPAGWTWRDGSGTRPATLEDLRAVSWLLTGIQIRGQYAEGASAALLDNFSTDLRH
jgi:hypothetical protein